MATVTLDVLDAVELAEMLEFLVECLDTLIAPSTIVPGCDGGAHDLDDLRGDVARLARPLLTSPLTPVASSPANRAASIAVEVDRGSSSSRGRPPQRAWLVRLRRADQSVVVAIGLSRTAADHLAAHLTDVIAPTTTTRE